jgi:magnesium transporter
LAAVTWTDLLDPTAEEIKALGLGTLPPVVEKLLSRPSTGEPAPRPRLLAVHDRVYGVMLVPVLLHAEHRVYYQEIDLIIGADSVMTIRKTPRGGEPFDPSATRQARRPDDSPGVLAYRIIDEIAEAYLDLIDGIDEEIDELDDHIEDWPAARVRGQISHIRHDLLNIRRTLGPTRDAIREVVDNRVEIEHGEVFTHRAELAFGLVYDKLLRASEGLDYTRDLLGGVRDYAQAKIANDQNEVTKRLTIAATLLLVPTFIVGLYGQNFRDIPELHWGWGYAWSWALIVVTTVLQLVYYRRKRWI